MRERDGDKKKAYVHAPRSPFSQPSLSLSSNLMARQDLADLGIGPDGAVEGGGGVATAPPPLPSTAPPDTPNAARRAGGFVAGVRPTKKG
jgi:hypothetical protein